MSWARTMLADGLPQVGKVDVRRHVAVAWAVEDVDELVVLETLDPDHGVSMTY